LYIVIPFGDVVTPQVLQQTTGGAPSLRVNTPTGATILRAVPAGQVAGGTVAGSATPVAGTAGKQIITVKAGQGANQPQIVTLVKTTMGMQVAQVKY
jgi:hypothetical protein